ncbi:YciI family protein [Catellatospora coxensis]|uniref:YCII-related domain-containing protein n=1 Tax=Catellatospora coxensis TaxID=310354 RepID=A0A8J3KW46_9ACTN|nr:YciI family protein [Catellatospora coxensis]GIG04206.1 hypothetical protein Cco03nite_09060 [Catellatospora coxensis]
MAQYAVLIYANDSAHRAHATREETAPHDRHAEELERSGAMVAAYALTTRDLATSVRGDVVTDGPFVDAKEIVAGFYILEAPDLDAALAIAMLNPACHSGGGVEIRPIAGGGVVERPA